MLQKYYQIWGKHRAINCLYTVYNVCTVYICNNHSDNVQPPCCNKSTHGSAKNTNTTKVLSASPKVEMQNATVQIASPKITNTNTNRAKLLIVLVQPQLATTILIVPGQILILKRNSLFTILQIQLQKLQHKYHLLLDKMKDFRHCSLCESCLAHCIVVQAWDRVHVRNIGFSFDDELPPPSVTVMFAHPLEALSWKRCIFPVFVHIIGWRQPAWQWMLPCSHLQ